MVPAEVARRHHRVRGRNELDHEDCDETDSLNEDDDESDVAGDELECQQGDDVDDRVAFVRMPARASLKCRTDELRGELGVEYVASAKGVMYLKTYQYNEAAAWMEPRPIWMDVHLLSTFETKIAATTVTAPAKEAVALYLSPVSWITAGATCLIAEELASRVDWPKDSKTVAVECGDCAHVRVHMKGLGGVVATIAEAVQYMVGHPLNVAYITRLCGSKDTYVLPMVPDVLLRDTPVARVGAVNATTLGDKGMLHWSNAVCRSVVMLVGEPRELDFGASPFRYGAAYDSMVVTHPRPTQMTFSRDMQVRRPESRVVLTHASDHKNVLNRDKRRVGRVKMEAGSLIALCGNQEIYLREVVAPKGDDSSGGASYVIVFYYFKNPKNRMKGPLK